MNTANIISFPTPTDSKTWKQVTPLVHVTTDFLWAIVVHDSIPFEGMAELFYRGKEVMNFDTVAEAIEAATLETVNQVAAEMREWRASWDSGDIGLAPLLDPTL